MDMLGNRVMTTSAGVTNGDNLIELDVQQLPAGIYVVDVTNGKSHYTEKNDGRIRSLLSIM